jgi:ABC-type transporter lipoprotein component MlaA
MVSLCSGRSTRPTRMLLVPILLGSLLLLQPAQAADEKPKNIDPFEHINRPLYKFYDLTDRFIL